MNSKRFKNVRFTLTVDEHKQLLILCKELGCNQAELARNKILYPSMLHLDPAKLLVELNGIGLEIRDINNALKIHRVHCRSANGVDFQFLQLYKDYVSSHRKLENLLRKIMIKVRTKG